MQVAVHFLPQSFSESSLQLKARQIAERLQMDHSANLSSLLDMSNAEGSEALKTFSQTQMEEDVHPSQETRTADIGEEQDELPQTEVYMEDMVEEMF